jgi:hypothetical protein
MRYLSNKTKTLSGGSAFAGLFPFRGKNIVFASITNAIS